MNIIGDLESANKYYIKHDDGSIEWTSNLSLAKSYIQDMTVPTWFGQTLYCTNEDVVKGYDDKLYIASEVPSKPQAVIIEENYITFKQQAKAYIQMKIEEYATKQEETSFIELISWYHSGIKEKKKLATDALKYRDKLYSYTQEMIEKIKTKYADKKDISEVYAEYLTNFPE